jgi:aminoglycoside 6'-N-acetyltransferase I
MLAALYPPYPESEHAPEVDAFLSGSPSESLLPSLVLVCERPEGGLAGLLELSVRDYAEGCAGATPYVESWYVDPDARGSGAGRALMAAAEEWARARGYREMASDTDLGNESSLRAHEAIGFEEVERTIHLRKPL